MTRTVAILGAGIGAQHLDGWLAAPDDFLVAAVVDRELPRARALAARVHGARALDRIDAVIDDPSIDIVDICLPPDLHCPVAVQALAAGKHVVCEKPMAASLSEADRMVTAVEAAGRVLMPIFQYRYGRAARNLDALQRAGLLGRPLVATLETHWDRRADYYAVPWRGTWAHEKGGAVLSHAIHIHDLVQRWFGPVDAVSAMLDTRANPIETEDCAAICLHTRSGGMISSSITLGAAHNSSRLRLVFEHLTAESDPDEPYAPMQAGWRYATRDPEQQDALDPVLGPADDEPDGYAGQFRALALHLRGGRADLVTAEHGRASIELVSAIYHAARSGQTVRLPLDRQLPICQRLSPPD